MGLLDGHAGAKESEPRLGKADHRGTTIDGDIACRRFQVQSQQAPREGPRATAELEHRLRGFERGMRDEIARGSFLIEGLPILFGTHPIVKGSRLPVGQDAHFLWHRNSSRSPVLFSLTHPLHLLTPRKKCSEAVASLAVPHRHCPVPPPPPHPGPGSPPRGKFSTPLP